MIQCDDVTLSNRSIVVVPPSRKRGLYEDRTQVASSSLTVHRQKNADIIKLVAVVVVADILVLVVVISKLFLLLL